jgi:glycosyltransferase involved in cell wall biosynthesis
MKFGFYSPYLDTFGGGERYMLTLASHFSKNNTVDIFWDEPEIKAPLSRFLKIDLTKTRFKENIFKYEIAKKLIHTRKYDVIFVLSDGSVPISFAKKNILHFQVPFNFPKSDLKTKVKIKKYQHIVCNSNFTKEFIDKSFNISSMVIYPPVDVKSIKPKPKEKIIISVGRFSPNQLHPKRQEILIEVFKEIYKKYPKWRLILARQAKKEDEKYLRSLKKSIRGFGIKIFENMPVEKLRVLYSKSSIYWHATGFGEDESKNPEKMEHFWISTVEAQAAGAVPVVIGVGGQKEIVIDGKNGLTWLTKAQLYEKTALIIKDQNLRTKLSASSIKSSKKFSVENFIKEYEKIIL